MMTNSLNSTGPSRPLPVVLTPLSPASRLANERIANDLADRIARAAARGADFVWVPYAKREILLALNAANRPGVNVLLRTRDLVDALDKLRPEADFAVRAFALVLAALRT
jgi:hypothetical protein